MRNIFWALIWLCAFPGLAAAETVEIYEADVKPWSGYWWPSSAGGMLTGIGYRGKPTVLDKLRAISPVNTSAVDGWYKDNFYDPSDAVWEGLCYAWALAAMSEPEPTRGGVYKGVPLNIGDKKAFLTLAHVKDVTYRANGAEPLIFHQWILSFLKENKKPFAINLRFEEEIWFFPVFRAEVRSRDSATQTEFETIIWYASDFVSPDFVGTEKGFSRQTYILYKNNNGYTHGEWTGESITNFPGSMLVTLERHGPPVDGFHMPTIEAAVAANADDLSSVEIYPGSYSAFLEPEWARPLAVEAGERLELEFALENRQVSLPVTITDGKYAYTETVSQANPRIRHLCRNARPVLSLHPEDRLMNSPFSLRFDLAREPLAVQTRRGVSFAWGGVAGLFDSPDGGRAFVTMRGRDGRPLRSIPVEAAGRSKFGQVFDPAEFDSWVFGRADQCEITSQQRPSLVGLAAYGRGMSAFSPLSVVGPQWVYGFLPGLGSAASFHVRNGEARAVSGVVRGWDSSGREVFTQDVKLAPHELKFFSWGAYPIPAPQGASLFSIDFGEARVGLEACFVTHGVVEMVPAAGEFSKEFLLSHYPNTSSWTSSVHILNSGNSTAEVGIETMDGRRLHTVFVSPHCSAQVDTASLPATGKTLRARSNVDIAVHVRYQAAGEDWAMLPLSRPDQARTEILVPHLPDAPWWAGVILDNANAGACEVVLEYFAASGEMLRSEQRVLDMYEPWVFTATRSPETAYLKVRASTPLGCRVLYGSDNLSAVAGYTP